MEEPFAMVTGVNVAPVENYIYTIRGKYVMIDIDLAKLYGVENRSLRQAVRRNTNKFPDDFMFRLMKDEANELINKGVSQNVIPPFAQQRCESSLGVGVLLRNSDFSDRGAGGKAAVPERDDGVCLTTVTGPVEPGP